MSIEALDRAIAILGTQDILAAKLKIKSPSISEWRSRGRVPHTRCREIEKITKGAVTRADLRPDIWGSEKKVA